VLDDSCLFGWVQAKQHVGEPQAQHVIEFLKDLVEHNMFVPCWKEVKQVMQLCEGKGDLSCDERAGKLRMKARNGNYRLTVSRSAAIPLFLACLFSSRSICSLCRSM
jgi:hypothetical protein